MNSEADVLIERLKDPNEENAWKISDQLAALNDMAVAEKLLPLLYSEEDETQYLAARTLSKMKNNHSTLQALLDAIFDKRNQHRNGALVEALEGYDLSEHFNDVFKIFLYGNFKASFLARELLDSVEFELVPRNLRKAEKHFKHFSSNLKKDGSDAGRFAGAEEIIGELKALFEGS
ncbi:MAG: HEAT repeat domain-containing protein [Cyclobacteriaceae bacterium]|nr:HEAT repeat domain-containing protein [Cyclobacteriaceae bacterium]